MGQSIRASFTRRMADFRGTTDREPHASILGRLFEMTWQMDPPLATTLAMTGPNAKICDIGAGGRRVRKDAVCVDVAPGPNVDVVGDIHAMPHADNSFDLVICTGTLNLCHDPRKALDELFRITKPGGAVHLEVGMFQPYNPEPEDYWRWTQRGLHRVMSGAGFQETRSGAHMGPITALTCAMVYISSRVFEGPGIAQRAVRAASHGAFGPLKYLDALLPERVRDNAPFAYGIYFVGTKPR